MTAKLTKQQIVERTRVCPCCEEFIMRVGRFDTHKFCSGVCYHTFKDLSRVSEEKASNWKGDVVKYSALHIWLRKKFGNAKLCENSKCPKVSNTYEWALKMGCEYKRERSNFMQLCKSCHSFLDQKGSGVWYSRTRGKWVAQIRLNGKTKYLGGFDEKEDAQKVRNEEVSKYYDAHMRTM